MRRFQASGRTSIGPLLVAAFIAAVVLQALALTVAGPAAAHGALKSTSPAEGEQLSVAPTEVVLDFNEVPLPLGTAVAVTDAQGSVVSTSQVQLNQRRLTQPLQPNLFPGNYRIAWRATSADGHPVSGELGFVVAASAGAGAGAGGASPAAGGAAAGAGAPDAGDGATGGAPSDPSAHPASAADASASPQAERPQVSATAGVNDGGGMSSGALLTGGAALLVLVAVAVSVLRRRRRTALSEEASTEGSPQR